MGLVALAVPFFLLLIVIEIVVDRVRGTGFYRINDAINSMSTGSISETTGFFTKFMGVAAFAFVAEHIAPFKLDAALFDPTTLTGFAAFMGVLVLYDFLYYWKHRMGHEVSWFWAAHSVHHQSEDYNLTTALRQTSMGFLIGWIFYLPIVLLGVPAKVYLTAGAIDLIYQFWVHTRHINRMGILDYILVTPSNHRVHHAQNDIYLDKNYGGILIIWDRIFGTFQDELDEEPVVFGVRKPLKSWNPFWANLQVYAQLFQDAFRAKRLRDKLMIWWKPPGWRPADVAEKYPIQITDGRTVDKFDPGVSPGAKYYTLFQFLAISIAVPAILLLGAKLPLYVLALACSPVWLTLYVIGVVGEGRSQAAFLEWSRLAIFALALGAARYLYPELVTMEILAGMSAYLVISAAWFARVKAPVSNPRAVPAPHAKAA